MTNKKEVSRKGDKDNIKLTITGIQSGEWESEPVVLYTRGRFLRKGRRAYLFYTEYSEEGYPVRNRLVLDLSRELPYVELKKEMGLTSILRFRPGSRETCIYHTVAGPMDLVSDTGKIHFSEEETGISLEMEYILFMAGSAISDYTLRIEGTFLQ